MFAHPSAVVSSKAKIGERVKIGEFCIIRDNVIIGDDTVIESFCEIGFHTMRAKGSPLIIGEKSLIRSHCVLYEGSSFEEKLITGHHTTIREGTIAGKNLRIGTFSDIQGDCKIGDYVRIHSNVFVSQKSVINDFVWLFPFVVLTDDPHPPSNIRVGPTIGTYAAIAARATILPGINIGERSLVAAGSLVTKDVPNDKFVMGVPAKIVGNTKDIKLKNNPDQPAYPWTKHFYEDYPAEIIKNWHD
jgi:acetyltransferase-like isoleucine patch superfamily enzyme